MGHYSSYSAFPAPLNIPSTSYLSHSHHDTRCASPSWSNRASTISDADLEATFTPQRHHFSPRASSYLSDDDLSDSFDDDAHSITSSGSDACSPPTMQVIQVHTMTDEEVAELQRAQAARRQELTRFLMLEKERKRMAASATRRRRGSSGGAKKGSPKTKLSAMTPIAEVGE